MLAINLIAKTQAKTGALSGFCYKIDEPAKQWNAMRALSKSSLFRNDSMPDSILIPVRPCMKCGATERYASGRCKPCMRASKADWYAENIDLARTRVATYRAAHPEKVSAYHAAYRAANHEKVQAQTGAWCDANPERSRAIKATWAATNPEKVKASHAAWRAENPEALRIASQNRRARKRESGGKLSRGLPAKLFKLQKGKCPCCNQPLGNSYHMDHIIPLALGGKNDDSNMQLLRQRCNQQKQAKDPIQFMQSRGFLL